MKKRIKKITGSDYTEIVDLIKDVGSFKPEMNICLYGKAGTGKTTLAGSYPKPLLIIECSEKGTDSISDIKGVKVLRCRNYDDAVKAYWYIKKNPDKFKSVAIDTVSHLQDMCIKKIVEEKGREINEGEIGNWGTMTKQMWGEVASSVKSLLMDFRNLPQDCIFIAHDRNFNNEEEDENNQINPSIGPRLSPSIRASLNAIVNIIGNTFIQETVKKIKIGKKIEEKRKIKYCLRIGPNAIYDTKVRKPKKFRLPDVLVNPDYNKLIDIVKGIEE
jgi:hypothetical protein